VWCKNLEAESNGSWSYEQFSTFGCCNATNRAHTGSPQIEAYHLAEF